MVGEAEVMVSEVFEEYPGLYSKYSEVGIMSTISKIQIFLLTRFSMTPFAYPFLNSLPQRPGIFSPQNLHLPFHVPSSFKILKV